MKRLYLVRHAKSSWADSSLEDVDRPLNKRGRRDAPVMGKRLMNRGAVVEAIWSSPAVRAKETARLLAKAISFPRKTIQSHDEIYSGTMDDILEGIRGCSDTVDNLLLVGHNSVLTDFANLLADPGGEEVDWLPTCGVAALEFSCSMWAQLQAGRGRLLFVDFPKNVETLA